jgi:hypothetical protein
MAARTIETEVVSTRLNEAEINAVDGFARAHDLNRSQAIGHLIRLGAREAIDARKPLEPVLTCNEFDGADFHLVLRREDFALLEHLLAVVNGYAVPPIEEMH